MKRQQNLSVSGSIILTILFAVFALGTYKSDPEGNPLALVPGLAAIVCIFLAIYAAINNSNESAKEQQQKKAATAIKHDISFGKRDLKFYFDKSLNKVTICLASTDATLKHVLSDFVYSNAVETDNYIVATDFVNHKILRATNKKGRLVTSVCDLPDELNKLNVAIKPSTPALKAYNDYAFLTDDTNEFIAIVTPDDFHVLRYSDIVSISYEENGNDVFNKSLGGAVVGGLLFGGVGAIVGGSTAKATQNKEVRNMSIKILLKSTTKSTIILKIYETGRDGSVLETKNTADRMDYEGYMKEVSGIKDIFSIIIDIVDKKSLSSSAAVSSMSVADELEKLAKLKASGIISEEEFQAQKAKLLGL